MRHSTIIILFLLSLFSGTSYAASVTLQWDASPGVVEGYKVYWKTGTAGGPPYAGTGADITYNGIITINKNSPATLAGTTLTVSLGNLLSGVNYYFVVTAYSGANESGYSNEVMWFDGGAPPPPIIIQPLPVAVNLLVQWNAVVSPNLGSYKVYYGTVSGVYNGTGAAQGASPVTVVKTLTTVTLTGLSDATYYVAVTSVSTTGSESIKSTQVSATVDTVVPPIPTGLSCRKL